MKEKRNKRKRSNSESETDSSSSSNDSSSDSNTSTSNSSIISSNSSSVNTTDKTLNDYTSKKLKKKQKKKEKADYISNGDSMNRHRKKEKDRTGNHKRSEFKHERKPKYKKYYGKDVKESKNKDCYIYRKRKFIEFNEDKISENQNKKRTKRSQN